MKTEKIKDIKRRFNNEWLLIEVTGSDRATTTSIKGKLIAHSPMREIIYKKAMEIKSKLPTLIDYSEDDLPKGMVAAFNLHD